MFARLSKNVYLCRCKQQIFTFMKQLVVRPKVNVPERHVEIDRNEMALAIKTWRAEKRMTQQQLADALGIHRATLSKAENGQVINWLVAYRIYNYLQQEE